MLADVEAATRGAGLSQCAMHISMVTEFGDNLQEREGRRTTHYGHWTMRFANGSFLAEAVV